jgi:Ca2+-binding EF-hand superfamily protein
LTVFCGGRFYSKQLRQPELTNIRDAVLELLDGGTTLTRDELTRKIKAKLGTAASDKLINEILDQVTSGTQNLQLK